MIEGINQEHALKALQTTRNPVERYIRLQVLGMDPTQFRKADARRQFNAFYRVRRGPSWQDRFFGLLENESAALSASPPTSSDFLRVLDKLFELTGRWEASFASKLVATANGMAPVIDSIVAKNIGRRVPLSSEKGYRANIHELYDEISRVLSAGVASPRGHEWTERFDAAFGHLPNIEVIKPPKKIDLLLWASR